MPATKVKNKITNYDSFLLKRVLSKSSKDFETLSLEAIFNNELFSNELLNFSLVDGSGDQGIDYVFIMLNGKFIQSTDEISSEENSQYNFYFIQFKDSLTNSFTKSNLMKFLSGTENIIKNESNKIKNKKLLTKIKQIDSILNTESIKNQKHSFNFYYVGNQVFDEGLSDLGVEFEKVANLLEEEKKSNSISNDSSFEIIDQKKILDLINTNALGAEVCSLAVEKNMMIKTNYKETLQTDESFDSYLGLVKVSEIKKMVNTVGSKIFDENIRASLGETKINKKIIENLNKVKNDFWVYNNGITIVSTGKLSLKRGNVLNIVNPSIIDGQQTTNSILETTNLDKYVLLKVISVEDSFVRHEIIIANNQKNVITPLNIMANNKDQIQFEKILKEYNILYERRKGQHGSNKQILTPANFINSQSSIFLGLPFIAKRSKSSIYTKSNDYYNQIWNETNIVTNIDNIISSINIFDKLDKLFTKEFKNVTIQDISFLNDNKAIFAKYYIYYTSIVILLNKPKYKFKDIKDDILVGIDLNLLNKSIKVVGDIINNVYSLDLEQVDKETLTLKNFVRTKSHFGKYQKRLVEYIKNNEQNI